MAKETQHVIGRIRWTENGTSPWVEFPSITAYRAWARDVRKARPGTKTEYEYFGHMSAEYLLESAREQGGLEKKHNN